MIEFDWLAKAMELRDSTVEGVIVTVVESQGSTPRDAGAKMIVTMDSSFGTVGGGNLEYLAIQKARDFLCGRERKKLHTIALGASAGQCCGGSVSVFMEKLYENGPKVVLFGAGHVAFELVEVLKSACRILVVDSREELLDRFPSWVKTRLSEAPEMEVFTLSEDFHVVILTHSHDLDERILYQALKEKNFPYLGMIGSRNKWSTFQKRLEAKGIEKEKILSVFCPVGVSGILSKRPRSVAISIAAGLMQQKAFHS